MAFNIVRASEMVLCTITPRDVDGPTTAVATDFDLPVVSEGTAATAITGADGASNFTFEVTAANAVHTHHIVTCSLSTGTAFINTFSFTTG